MSSGSGAIGRAGHGGGRAGGRVSALAVALGCALFLGGFAWAAVAYRPYTVPTGSMLPAVHPGDRVLAERVSGSAVRRGDVVVFRDRRWGDVPMVKRVVGVGGDIVACCAARGRLTVNGTPVDEGYLPSGGAPASLTRFTARVPTGGLFLLGDDRAVSEDSRARLTDDRHGSVPRSAVRARVEATVWPPGRIGVLGRTGAFDALPGGGGSRPGPLTWITLVVIAGAALILGGAAYAPVARLARRR